LLKTDVSEDRAGCSDSRIVSALDTNISMVTRGAPAVTRIFDGEKEAKLIALACAPATRRLAGC
jgi:hypothetical protein